MRGFIGILLMWWTKLKIWLSKPRTLQQWVLDFLLALVALYFTAVILFTVVGIFLMVLFTTVMWWETGQWVTL